MKHKTSIIILTLSITTILIGVIPCAVHAEKVIAVSTGGTQVLSLTDEGNVYAWGANGDGQLGTGESADVNGLVAHRIPKKVLIDNVTVISADYVFSLALKSDGTVWAWGDNYHGELGNGSPSINLSTVPVQVQGLSDVIAIAAGNSAGYALKRDGTVWAWGRNDQGQLGDGTTENRCAPIQVKGLSGIKALGEHGIYAIGNDGTVWAWGDNTYIVDGEHITYGVLGDKTGPGLRLTPFQIQDVSDVTQITGGGGYGGFTMYLKEDGSVWSWGINYSGQLGDGTIHESRPPLVTFPSVRTRISDVKKISSTGGYGMAIKNDGTVWQWGVVDMLEIKTKIWATPAKVNGLYNVVDISAGSTGVIFTVTEDGGVWGWGWDQGMGLLGNNHERERKPVLIFSLSTETTPTDGNETPGTTSPVTVLPSPGMGFGTILAATATMIGAYAIIGIKRKKNKPKKPRTVTDDRRP